jgi:OOP family OmpA-OmpF porin
MNSERATGPLSRQDLERPINTDSPVVADREPGVEALGTGNGATPNSDFATLRQLLIGPEQRRLGELAARLDEMHLTPTELAELLPEAIALRASRDRALGRALAPTVETALHESVRRNPREVAAAIFPVLGPAIRKAIAETMGALVRSINSAVESSLSLRGLKWRVEAWRTGVPYAQVVIKHALVYRVEQVFLIHAESGLLLNHVTAADLDAPNADLISAMLTAIQDFVHDSFRPNEGATLRTFTVGEHTVHLEVGPRALLAAVVRGTPPEALAPRLQSALERIHLEWAQQLVDFRGDATVFEPVRPLLEECLETVLSTQQARARGARAWLRWAVPLTAAVVLALGLTIRSRLNWQRALRTLDAEPGIVLVDASRGWTGWRFNGLKDPLARDPSVVLAAAGFSPRAIRGRWDSYLALDSGVVAIRARRSLAIPATATIDVRADTLVLGGTAGVDWLARVRGATLPIGATTIDVSAVKLTLPPALDSLREAIERQLILFDAGSSQLTQIAATQLRGVSLATRRLVDAVTSAGATVRIELFGRTDPTGADSTNRSLAQLRVDRISRGLLSFGVPREMVAGQPIATDNPLDDSDPARRARINRSVAFNVEVNAVQPRPK